MARVIFLSTTKNPALHPFWDVNAIMRQSVKTTPFIGLIYLLRAEPDALISQKKYSHQKVPH